MTAGILHFFTAETGHLMVHPVDAQRINTPHNLALACRQPRAADTVYLDPPGHSFSIKHQSDQIRRLNLARMEAWKSLSLSLPPPPHTHTHTHINTHTACCQDRYRIRNRAHMTRYSHHNLLLLLRCNLSMKLVLSSTFLFTTQPSSGACPLAIARHDCTHLR